MSEPLLTPGADPAVLVPGDVEALESLSRDLLLLARDAGRARAVLQDVRAGGWAGPAAREFGADVAKMPGRLGLAEEAFRAAGSALYLHAEVLTRARTEARAAVEQVARAEAATRAWVEAGGGTLLGSFGTYRPVSSDGGPLARLVPVRDPGDAERRAAERRLALAREEVHLSGQRAAIRLRRAGEAAPRGPGLMSKLSSWSVSFGAGVVEGGWETVRGIGMWSPLYFLASPEGYTRHKEDVVAGAVYGAGHPREFAAALLGVDTWREDPARALGELASGAALTAATFGVGAAAHAGGRAALGAERLGRVGTTARRVGVPTAPRPTLRQARREILDAADPRPTSSDVVATAEQVGCERRSGDRD